MAALFAQTKRLKEALTLINQVDVSKFSMLLTRIIGRLATKATRIFTEAEEEQLTQLTGFSEADLATTLDGCAYLLDQGAYRGVNATVLSQQLQEAGMSIEHATAFATVWKERAATFVAQLRDRALGMPQTLHGADWRLHLSMGQNTLNKTQELRTLFNFQLGAAAAPSATDSFCAEFTEAQLFEFYMQLEKVQEQLDSLT